MVLHRASSRDEVGWPGPSCAELGPAVLAVAQCPGDCHLPRGSSARGGSLAPIVPTSQTLP